MGEKAIFGPQQTKYYLQTGSRLLNLLIGDIKFRPLRYLATEISSGSF